VQSEAVDFTGQPRYRMDPLTEEYARELLSEVPAAERVSALDRLVTGWFGLILLAGRDRSQDPYGPQQEVHGPLSGVPAELPRRVQADPARWFSIEYRNLQTVCRLSCTDDRRRAAARLDACPFPARYRRRGDETVPTDLD
jgi:hypothetical protein